MSKWKMLKLGDIFEITSGGTPSKMHPEYYENGTIYWVKTGDLKGKYLISVPSLITEDGLKNSSAKIFPVGTILLAMYGATIGACSILKVEAATNQACAAFLPNEDIDKSYFYYFLCSKKEEFIKLGVGGAQPNISAAILKNVKISLPPIEEQKRIADILDKANSLIDLRKQQLEKMDLLIKSKFIDMFGDPVTNSKGWEVKSLKDIALGKLSYGSGASATEYDLNVRYIRITDINEKGCLNVHKVSPNEISDEYILREGDILFARSGATVGKTFRYSEKYGKCIYAGYLIRLVPNQKIVLPDYIYYLTKTDYYLSFVQQSMKTVAQPNINAQQYGALQIPIPPIFLQNQFAAFVEQVEKQKAVMQQSLEKMETNYKALMQEYFG